MFKKVFADLLDAHILADPLSIGLARFLRAIFWFKIEFCHRGKAGTESFQGAKGAHVVGDVNSADGTLIGSKFFALAEIIDFATKSFELQVGFPNDFVYGFNALFGYL